MPIANLQIDFNETEVKDYINQQLDLQIRAMFLLWDLEEMKRQTCMSKTFLEIEFLQDPRMKIHERRKEKGKRYWLYKESVEVLKLIMDEW